MRRKPPTLYCIPPSQVQSIRTQLNWSIRRTALYAGVHHATWKYYEDRGISNGAIADKVRAIASSNGVIINE
jgi:hypothetical protein